VILRVVARPWLSPPRAAGSRAATPARLVAAILPADGLAARAGRRAGVAVDRTQRFLFLTRSSAHACIEVPLARLAPRAQLATLDNALDTTATSGVLPILSTTGESLGLPVVTWLPSVLRGQGVRYESAALATPLKLRGIPG
jgi:hypothetical protein